MGPICQGACATPCGPRMAGEEVVGEPAGDRVPAGNPSVAAACSALNARHARLHCHTHAVDRDDRVRRPAAIRNADAATVSVQGQRGRRTRCGSSVPAHRPSIVASDDTRSMTRYRT